jgi:hypothetical protein
MPPCLDLSSFTSPAGIDLRTSPTAYDAATGVLAPIFAARFHPALRCDANHAFHVAARQWRPGLTLAGGVA